MIEEKETIKVKKIPGKNGNKEEDYEKEVKKDD